MRVAAGLLAATLVVVLGACGGDDGETPTDRPPGQGTLPTDDPSDMTAAEHREAACDEVAEVLSSVSSGDLRVSGDQLDFIISHTGAADDEALDEAANDWAHGIADGDVEIVNTRTAELERLCEL